MGFENQRYRVLAQNMADRKAILAEFENRRETLRASISASESRLEKMQLAALENEKELEIASRNVSEANEKIVRLDRDISVSIERLINLKLNVERFEQDVQSYDSQIEENIRLQTQIGKSIVERESGYQKSLERVHGATDELARFDKKLQIRRDQADQLGRDQIELINELGESRNLLSTQKTNLSNALERRERDKKEIQNLEIRLEEYQEAIELCRKQLLQVDEENRNLHQEREVLLSRIEQEDLRYQKLVEREKHLRLYCFVQIPTQVSCRFNPYEV